MKLNHFKYKFKNRYDFAICIWYEFTTYIEKYGLDARADYLVFLSWKQFSVLFM